MASMYGDRAELYDRIYAFKDYAAEAAALRARLHAEGVGDGARVLEAGCGTGAHMVHLRASFGVRGFDLAEGMLDVARKKGLDVFRADMADFAVDEPVDAVLSLFSGIGYLLDEATLRRAARCMADALRPGGVLIVEPWLEPGKVDDGRPSVQTAQDRDLALARACVFTVEGDRSILDFHWLVARRGQPVEHFEDRHVLWLCPRETMRRAFADAGFDVRYDPDGLGTGRGLFVGRRRGEYA